MGASFLTDAWFDDLAARAASLSPDPSVTISIRQVVGDMAWTVRVASGRVTVDRDDDHTADVTLTTDVATGRAIADGELSAQDAIAAGRLRLGGDMTSLLAAGPVLAALTER